MLECVRVSELLQKRVIISFCTIQPNRLTVFVPGTRLNIRANIVDAERIVPSTVEFVDVASLVKNASKGEGLS